MSATETPVVTAASVTADTALAGVLPRGAAEQLQAVPIELNGDVLTVAMMEPGDVFVLDELQRLTGRRIKPVSISHADLRILMGRVYAGGADADSEVLSEMGARENMVVLGSIRASADESSHAWD